MERYEFSCRLNWVADCWWPFSPWTGIPHYFAAVCYCRRHGKILSVTCTITFSFSRLFGEIASHTLKLLGQSYKGRALFLYFNFYISVVFVFYWWQTKSLTTRGTKPYVARIVKRRTVTVSDLAIMSSFFFSFTHTRTQTHTQTPLIFILSLRHKALLQQRCSLRAQEVCESRGGRPGLPVPNSLYGLFVRKATLK